MFTAPGWDGQLQNMNLQLMVPGFSLVLLVGLVAGVLTVLAAVRRHDGDGTPLWLIVLAGLGSLISVSMAPSMLWVALQAYWAFGRR